MKKFNMHAFYQFSSCFHMVEFTGEYLLEVDAIRWKQSESRHFSRGYNFLTKDLSLTLKISIHPYSCPAKVIIRSELFEMGRFITWKRIKSVRFRNVPIWLHHTVVRVNISVSDKKAIITVKALHWEDVKNTGGSH